MSDAADDIVSDALETSTTPRRPQIRPPLEDPLSPATDEYSTPASTPFKRFSIQTEMTQEVDVGSPSGTASLKERVNDDVECEDGQAGDVVVDAEAGPVDLTASPETDYVNENVLVEGEHQFDMQAPADEDYPVSLTASSETTPVHAVSIEGQQENTTPETNLTNVTMLEEEEQYDNNAASGEQARFTSMSPSAEADVNAANLSEEEQHIVTMPENEAYVNETTVAAEAHPESMTTTAKVNPEEKPVLGEEEELVDSTIAPELEHPVDTLNYAEVDDINAAVIEEEGHNTKTVPADEAFIDNAAVSPEPSSPNPMSTSEAPSGNTTHPVDVHPEEAITTAATLPEETTSPADALAEDMTATEDAQFDHTPGQSETHLSDVPTSPEAHHVNVLSPSRPFGMSPPRSPRSPIIRKPWHPVRPKSPNFWLAARASTSASSPKYQSSPAKAKPKPTPPKSHLGEPLRPKSPNFALAARASSSASAPKRTHSPPKQPPPPPKSKLGQPLRPKSPNFALAARAASSASAPKYRHAPPKPPSPPKKSQLGMPLRPKSPRLSLAARASSSASAPKHSPNPHPAAPKSSSKIVHQGPVRPKSPKLHLAARAAAQASAPKRNSQATAPPAKPVAGPAKPAGAPAKPVAKNPAWGSEPTRPVSPNLKLRKPKAMTVIQKEREKKEAEEKERLERQEKERAMKRMSWQESRTQPKTPAVLKRRSVIADVPEPSRVFRPTPLPAYLQGKELPEVKTTRKSIAAAASRTAPPKKEGPRVVARGHPTKTRPEPFDLQGVEMHEREVEKMKQKQGEVVKRVFEPVELRKELLEGPTFVPTRSQASLTEPVSLLPHSEERRRRTQAFFEDQRERMKEVERLEEEAKKMRDQAEREEVERAWKEKRFKPRPVPKSHYVGQRGDSEGQVVTPEEVHTPDEPHTPENGGLLEGLKKSLSPLLGMANE